MTETLQITVTVASMVSAVLVVGTVIVWLAGRLGRAVEQPACRLGRYLFPGDGDGHNEDDRQWK